MPALRRALAVGAALSGLLLGASVALTTPAQATDTSGSVRVVDSCDQTPAAGHFACYAQRRADLGYRTRTQMATQYSTPAGYGPASLQDAYDLTSAAAANGTAERVYVVDAYDDPTAEADLAVYRHQYGLPACTIANGCFRKLNQSGATSPLPATDAGWAGEIALDLQMVSAVCPRCGITLIEATDPSDNLFTAVREANNLGAKFVSMSWGGGEYSTESNYDSRYFASTGVVYTVATGDNGYSAGASYPATSPRVVAVGGTSLRASSNARGWSETAWSGAGSGCSGYETKPSWQSTVSSATCNRRANADVSAVANPSTGVAVYDTTGGSGWAVYGGTSAAAPIIAAAYALAGTPAANESPVAMAYAHSSLFNDVTSGTNGTCSATALCTAGSGWDGPTGLGTPNGIGAFTPTTTTTSPAPTPTDGDVVTLTAPSAQTSVAGTADSLQLSATDSADSALSYTADGLPIGLSLDRNTGLISGTPTTAGSSQVTVVAADDSGATDSATFTWTVTSAPAVCTGNVIANSGFESGTAGWSTNRALITRSTTAAHLGTHLARLDGTGHTQHDVLARTIRIPAGCHATLRFYVRVLSNDTSPTAHDKLSVTAGSTLLAAYSNRNRGSRYVARTVSLSAYAGHSVTLRFSGYENSSIAITFLLDDVSVTLSR